MWLKVKGESIFKRCLNKRQRTNESEGYDPETYRCFMLVKLANDLGMGPEI